MLPVTQPIGTRYGVPGHMWACGHHTGTDFLAPIGTPVRAVADGKVIHAANGGGWGAAYGLHVIVESTINGHTYQVLYAHLSAHQVNPGATVKAGQVLGKSGRTGNVTGPHLHLEIRTAPYRYGDDVDPMPLIERPATHVHTKPQRPDDVREAIHDIKDALKDAGPVQADHLKDAKHDLKKINKR